VKSPRHAIVATGAVGALLVPSAPASAAASAAVFQGTATVGCFGCGDYGPPGNNASFTVTGLLDGVGVLDAPGTASVGVTEPIGVTCVISGRASGIVTVARVGTTYLHWTRTGAFAVVLTGWGSGPAVFAITSPVGNPCGGVVMASFAGSIASA
jgi:hypothetical protein